jgi:hypothetical protein
MDIFTRPTTTSSYDPPYFMKAIRAINYCVIDAAITTHTTKPTILATTTTSPATLIINDKPIDIPNNEIKFEAAIKEVDK